MDAAPDHWTLLVGPSNWFEVHHPPQWKSEERSGTIAIRPAESDALVAFNTVWIDDPQAEDFPSLQNVIEQFPQTRNVTEFSEGSFSTEACYQGDAVLAPSLKWWEKMLTHANWRSWTMWSFRSGNLLIVVTLLHAGERDHDLESLARMMLGTLQISGAPADPPEVFAQKAAELARAKYPLLDVRLVDDFQLIIATSKLNLRNFYRAYTRSPEQFEKILLPAFTTAVQVQGWGDKEASPDLELVRDRLMPMLYPQELWQEKFPNVVGVPWIAGLAVLYVVDEAHAYWYVRDELLEQWNMTAEELHELTLDNLQSHFEQEPMEMALATSEDGTPTMMMPNSMSSYNSVRLLSESFRERMREAVTGDLIVGVPGRDFFVALSMKAPEMLSQMRKQVKSDFQNTDHPLTDRLLLITADGVSELMDQQL